MFNVIFSVATGKWISDLGAGLNMYSVSMLQDRFYIKFVDYLTFNYFMVCALSAYHQDHMFFPITWREEDQVSNVKLTKQAFQTMGIALSYFLRRRKYLEKDMRAVKYNDYSADLIKENGVLS